MPTAQGNTQGTRFPSKGVRLAHLALVRGKGLQTRGSWPVCQHSRMLPLLPLDLISSRPLALMQVLALRPCLTHCSDLESLLWLRPALRFVGQVSTTSLVLVPARLLPLPSLLLRGALADPSWMNRDSSAARPNPQGLPLVRSLVFTQGPPSLLVSR